MAKRSERNALKPVPCGCGGEAHHDSSSCWNPEEEEWMPNFWHRVICKNCGTQTKSFFTEAEAIQAWNRAMSGNVQECAKDARCDERTAKVIEHDASVTDTDGYKYLRMEYLCGDCKKKVLGGDDYCSHCGSKLIWREEELEESRRMTGGSWYAGRFKNDEHEAVRILDMFCKAFCIDVEVTDDLEFRCLECPFHTESGQCQVKIFKSVFYPDYKDFGSMGDL